MQINSQPYLLCCQWRQINSFLSSFIHFYYKNHFIETEIVWCPTNWKLWNINILKLIISFFNYFLCFIFAQMKLWKFWKLIQRKCFYWYADIPIILNTINKGHNIDVLALILFTHFIHIFRWENFKTKTKLLVQYMFGSC